MRLRLQTDQGVALAPALALAHADVAVFELQGPALALRLATLLLFVGTAVLATMVLRGAWSDPAFAIVGAAVLGAALALRWWSQARLVKALQRGDVGVLLAHWASLGPRLPDAATTLPIMRATAFAAFGRLEEARGELDRAPRGPAWEAALEHRTVIETLLSTFAGELAVARAAAARLAMFPLPEDPAAKQRSSTLRDGLAALARAFARQAIRGDAERLTEAATESPLVYWAMRYGAAVIAIDSGDTGRAQQLVESAPSWPDESVFSSFQAELARELAARRSLPGQST